jgi:tRNA-dihydrouridine synthase
VNRGFWSELPKPFVALAPMADVTDPAFRRVIAACGKPDVTWTEFVSADGLALAPEAGRRKLLGDLRYSEAERPIVAQIFSSNPAHVESAARLCAELGFDGVDINMGCPDKSVERQGCGAAMIKTPGIALEVVAAAKRGAGDVPVSVKTRLGYGADILEEWLPKLLSARPAAITLHARTRKEMSSVPARWNRIADAVKMRDEWSAANGIPEGERTLILGNGDVRSLEDALAKGRETGADGVMVGRAVLGNPWFFAADDPLRKFSPFFQSEDYAHKHGGKAFESQAIEITPELIARRLETLATHIQLFADLLPWKSFATMKKHFKAYVSGWRGAKELRERLMACGTGEEAVRILRDNA